MSRSRGSVRAVLALPPRAIRPVTIVIAVDVGVPPSTEMMVVLRDAMMRRAGMAVTPAHMANASRGMREALAHVAGEIAAETHSPAAKADARMAEAGNVTAAYMAKATHMAEPIHMAEPAHMAESAANMTETAADMAATETTADVSPAETTASMAATTATCPYRAWRNGGAERDRRDSSQDHIPSH